MFKKLIGPERKIKQSDLYGITKKFRKGKASPKQIHLLESVMDMDYLAKLQHDDVAREFIADFIGEWSACDTNLRTKESEASRRYRMRDISTLYTQVDLSTDASGEPTDDITTVAATKTERFTHNKDTNPLLLPNPNIKPKSDYTLRDYMPSLTSSIDAIIDAIDSGRSVTTTTKKSRKVR